jgi:hypothetical protein
MDWTHQRSAISSLNSAADDIVCCSACSGVVITAGAWDWSQFALGQLVALGIATFIFTLVVFVLSLFSLIG